MVFLFNRPYLVKATDQLRAFDSFFAFNFLFCFSYFLMRRELSFSVVTKNEFGTTERGSDAVRITLKKCVTNHFMPFYGEETDHQ